MTDTVLNEPERAWNFVPVVGKHYYNYRKDELEASRKARRKQQGYKMEITVAPKEGDSRRSDRSNRTERKRRD